MSFCAQAHTYMYNTAALTKKHFTAVMTRLATIGILSISFGPVT